MPFSAPATGFRSFQDTKSRLWRSRWTMQVCTVACGKTAVIASGKPFRPSTTAISTSSTPRFFSSFVTQPELGAPAVINCGELGCVFGLDAEMRDPGRATRARADREIDARIVEHPFYVIVLDDGRRGREQRRIKPGRLS